MAGKAKMPPQPVDMPLARAYLRQFSGWSNEYPPGLSEPSSLRLMENVQITREGAAKIRPGMRYLSYNGVTPTNPMGTNPVSSHETFFLDDGRLAYLIAVREGDDTIGFRVMTDGKIWALTDADGGDFVITPSEAALRFTSATTYVRFLQIDNKIFALSNAGETMRLFTVGEGNKTAKLLNSQERPNWDVADKLTVVHPEAAWINDAIDSTTRINRILNPSFEYGIQKWSVHPETAGGGAAKISRNNDYAGQSGSYSLIVESTPWYYNLMPEPLDDPATNGLKSWPSNGGLNIDSKVVEGDYLRANVSSGAVGRAAHVVSPEIDVVGGETYFISWGTNTIGTSTYFTTCRVEWYNSGGGLISTVDHDVIAGAGAWTGRIWLKDADTTSFGPFGDITAPANAVKAVIKPRVQVDKAGTSYFTINKVMFSTVGGYRSGNSGADYYWAGVEDESVSEYQPATDIVIQADDVPIGTQGDQTLSFYVRADDSVATVTPGLRLYDSGGSILDTYAGSGVANTVGAWTRIDDTFSTLAEPSASRMAARFSISQVARGETHRIDAVLLENASVAGTYFDGDGTDTATEDYIWIGTPGQVQSWLVTTLVGASVPTAETRTASTLISSAAADNVYNFGFFYTLSNEIGESAPSQVTVVETQRGWTAWQWMEPNTSGEPDSTAETTDPSACADQLVAIMPTDVFNAAMQSGATKWTLYMLTWSDDQDVPATAVRIAEQELDSGSVHASDGYLALTPQQVGASELAVPLPTFDTRYNASEPSRGGQGLVAADRLIMVLDPTNAARIAWSSNQQGLYHDFTPHRGGGYKTLTYGNLMVPAAVKLWQNPQSVDTLTILCLGTDGRSTGFYMAPANVAQQSEQVTIMGFEETTATPGTTSPYGCEVLNNALYHPLDDQLMKSTANNYNISHKTMTDQIRKTWTQLQDKEKIVSCQLDNRLYYLVNNPAGADLEDGCRGNEIWVLDTAAKEGTWSRWLVQGVSLRTIQKDGYIYMSVSRPDGIYYLDPEYYVDDYVDSGAVLQRNIPWRLETNTQGANRAHDAWCQLQQANVVLGNFLGRMQIGIRGLDVNGKRVDITKVITDTGAASDDGTPWDLEDFFLIRRAMKEWFFYASSTVDDQGDTEFSRGQIGMVQYRYRPISVNVGYEYGSVETFEYGRSVTVGAETLHDSGTPQPYIDTARP